MKVVKDVREVQFEVLLKKFNSLIQFAAERMAIPGKIDSDDQYQEGCLVLKEVLDTTLNGGVYGFADPNCNEFAAVFKTGLWWRLTQKLNAHKAKCRDVRKETSPYISSDEGDEIALWDFDTEVCRMTSLFEMPGSALEFKEVLGLINGRLPENGKKLVALFIDPTPMKDLIEEYVKGRQRVPNKRIPLHLYRTYLGMTRFPFEDLMYLVKNVVLEVMVEFGRDVKQFQDVPDVEAPAPVEVVDEVEAEPVADEDFLEFVSENAPVKDEEEVLV